MLRSVLNTFQGYRQSLRAQLNGVNGFTGGGEISYAVSISGANSITVTLSGVAGQTADIFAEETLIVTAPIKEGRAGKKFTSTDGAVIPDFAEGSRIEVRQNGHIILAGVFADK